MRSRALASTVDDQLPWPAELSDRPAVTGWVAAGMLAGMLAIGGFGTWAAIAPLSSAAVAPGSVKVDTNHKTIQHLEGGIIGELLVRNGDEVKRGQVLLRLDALDAEADRNAVRAQLDALAAAEARLAAERDGRTGVIFPASLTSRRGDPIVAELLAGQTRIFQDHKRALNDDLGVWSQRIEQYRAQITSLDAQVASVRAQLPMFEEELQAQQYLNEKGLSLKPKLLALQRQIEAAKGDIAANKGRIASLNKQIAEAEVQMNGVRSARAKAVSEELQDVQTNRANVEEQLRKLGAKAERREVLAPEDGTVMNMKFFTPGGVIAPGAAILDLVPRRDKLVLEARVQPLDIDVVQPEMPATVRLVAYKQRITPTLEGKVTRVSADAITDDKTGMAYYSADIEVEASELARVPGVKLYPGMPVEVSVVIGERTFLDYLVQPLVDSFSHAFREQ